MYYNNYNSSTKCIGLCKQFAESDNMYLNITVLAVDGKWWCRLFYGAFSIEQFNNILSNGFVSFTFESFQFLYIFVLPLAQGNSIAKAHPTVKSDCTIQLLATNSQAKLCCSAGEIIKGHAANQQSDQANQNSGHTYLLFSRISHRQKKKQPYSLSYCQVHPVCYLSYCRLVLLWSTLFVGFAVIFNLNLPAACLLLASLCTVYLPLLACKLIYAS